MYVPHYILCHYKCKKKIVVIAFEVHLHFSLDVVFEFVSLRSDLIPCLLPANLIPGTTPHTTKLHLLHTIGSTINRVLSHQTGY